MSSLDAPPSSAPTISTRAAAAVVAGALVLVSVNLSATVPDQTSAEQPRDSEPSASSEGEQTSGRDLEVPPAGEVIEALDTLYRSDASHATMKMTVEKPRGARTLKLESWSKGEERMLVVIREPAREAGTATLRTPDGLWNYAPRADRLIRIPSGLLSDNWMGSHFTNDDLVRETSYDDDYEGAVEPAELDGRPVWKLILTPRPDAPVVYSRVLFYVTRADWIPLRTEYLDAGEVVRTMTYSKVEEVGQKKIPMKMTLRPADGESEYTRIEYDTLDFDVDLSDRLFSRRGLRRRAD